MRESVHRSNICLAISLLVLISAFAARAGEKKLMKEFENFPTVDGLTVFHGLEEATARIQRLKSKPHERTIAANGSMQPEILIFKSQPHGAEIWSLTCGLYQDLANIERRPAWNCDGSIKSFIGNRVFRQTDGFLYTGRWSGHSYVMFADGTNLKKLACTGPGGEKGIILAEKFNIWDRKDPRALYMTAIKDGNTWRSWSSKKPDVKEMWLMRIRLDDQLHGIMEPLYRFPSTRRKLIQNISDSNILLIQDINARRKPDANGKRTGEPEYMPLYYVIDLNRKPDEPGFAQSHTLAYNITGVDKHDPNNEYQVHGITISRDGKRVAWNYGSMTAVGEYVGFSVPADNINTRPTARLQKTDKWGQYQSHPGSWSDGRKAYFSGPNKITQAAGIKGNWGLWVRMTTDSRPVSLGFNAAGGHVTWCGNDPDWFFANTSRRTDNIRTWPLKWGGKIIAGKADGSEYKILCDPYDRQRGGKAGYDGIPRPNQSPDATKCWYHSSMLMPSNKYTGSYVAVFRRPHPPIALQGKPVEDKLQLTWTPHKLSSEIKGYHVYGRKGEQWDEITDKAVPGTTYAAQKGYEAYAVTAEEHSRLVSDTTSPLVDASGKQISKGVRDFDRTAPPEVAGLAIRKDKNGWLLSWQSSPAGDLRYYNLYCSVKGPPKAEQARRFASPPAGTTTFLDWAAPPADKLTDGKVFYAITAVDRQGNESEPAQASR